jgi:glycosyltransferase involved in cell wall biosynthesis
MARQADGVIVTNQADEETLTAARLATPLRQIPIGSNITAHPASTAELAEVRRALNLRPTDVLLAYFGFVNESKGADTLITALAGLDERHHLVFIGGQTGSSDTANNQQFWAHLQQMMATLGVEKRVHWTGFLPDEEVSAHLGAADLLVMPYHDGASLRRGTLMAGLAHGRALITTHPNYPLPELRHGENVWLVPPADAAALGEAIRHVGGDAPLCAQLGTAAQQLAEQFTWDKIAAQTAAFFAEREG